MTGPRLPLLVLVLIAVAFAVGLAIAPRDDTAREPDPEGDTWVHRLGEKLIPAVDVKTLSGPCLAAGGAGIAMLASPLPCEIAVPPARRAWQRVRRLKLRRVQGVQIEVRYDGIPEEKVKFEKATTSVIVLKQGGKLFVFCPPLGQKSCKVELE